LTQDAARAIACGLFSAGPESAGLCQAAGQLAARHLRFSPDDPHWPDRDRIAFDPALAAFGAAFGRLTGAGQAMMMQAARPIGVGAGLTLAERMCAARFGRSLVDHRVWVLTLGQDLATGPVQEAAWLAGAWRLGRLTVIAAVEDGEAPGLAGFAANGWTVRRVSAGDEGATDAALSAATRSQKPTLIACCGEGAEPLLLQRPDCDAAWFQRQAGARRIWLKRVARHAQRHDFELAATGRLTPRWHVPLSDPAVPQTTAASTAETIRQAVSAMAPAMPELVQLPGEVGWAALPQHHEPPACAHRAGGRLTAGIGAALCGVALHGGVLPICAQKVGAVENLLAGLRCAADQGARLVQILIEPGDGPLQTGYRASLRSLRNLFVFRPADGCEALECCELALRRQEGPSVLLLSDIPVAPLTDRPSRTRSIRGGFVAAEAAGPRALTLIASGPELTLALRVRAHLARAGVRAAVVSLPCWDLFAAAEDGWRDGVLGEAPRIGLEPGSGFGWDRWLGPAGLFIATGAIGDDAAGIVAATVRRHLQSRELDT